MHALIVRVKVVVAMLYVPTVPVSASETLWKAAILYIVNVPEIASEPGSITPNNE